MKKISRSQDQQQLIHLVHRLVIIYYSSWNKLFKHSTNPLGDMLGRPPPVTSLSTNLQRFNASEKSDHGFAERSKHSM